MYTQFSNNNTVKILLIDGAARKDSHTRKLLYAAQPYFEKAGAEVVLFDHTQDPLPMYDEHEDSLKRTSVQKFLHLTKQADGIILSSPEYHGSMSGTIKNALDWMNYLEKGEHKALTGKVVGLLGGGATFANMGASIQLMMAIRALHGWLMPEVLMSVQSIWEAFNEKGRLHDDKSRKRMQTFAEKMVKYTHMFKSKSDLFT